MSKAEIENEKPSEIFGIVSEIIDFNKETQKQQEGSRLKILTLKPNAWWITNFFSTMKSRK